MTHVITSSCDGVCDQGCLSVCPVDCIAGPLSPETVEQRRRDDPGTLRGVQLYIDPDECIDCGACAPECPVDAIRLDVDLPEGSTDALRNARFFADRRSR